MPTETRLQVNTYFDNNYFDNTSRLITGNELNAGLKKISAAFLNITDDANVNGGYMQIDNFGKVDVSKIKSASPAGYFLRDNGTWQNIVGAITWGTIGGTLSNQTDLQSALNAKFNVSAVDIDATLSGNSDSLVASQKATRTYVTASVYALSTTLGLNGILTNSNSTSGKNIILSNGDLLRSTANNVNLTFGGSGSGEFVDIITASGAEVYLENGYGVYLSQDSSGARTIEMTVTGIGITHNGNVAFSLGGDMSLIGGFKLLSQGASTVPYIDASNRLVSSAITPTELNYLSGTNSNIQNQLNNLAIGIGGWKTAARVLADSNINISSPGATINGVTMAINDRVVLNGNTTGSENGVWVWNGAAVAMTRATDCSTGNASNTGVLGMVITIEEGTYADQFWVLTNNATITIGTTSLVYAKGSATTYTGSDGITLTGNNFTLNNSYFTGDATITAGAISIGANKVVNSMINSVAWSKVTGTPTTFSGYGIVDTTSNLSEGSNLYFTNSRVDTRVQSYTGDITLSGTVYSIGSGKVTNAMLAGSISDSNISSASNWNTAYTNRITSLTVTGSSGAATLISNVLNIPTYTLDGLGGAPLASPVFTTNITAPLIYGGAAVGSTLQLQSTSANGTTSVAGIQFLVGNNGATTAASIYNNGQFLIGSTTIAGGTLSRLRVQAGGTGTIDIGDYSGARGAIWINQSTPSSTNWALSADTSNNTFFNGGSSVRISVAGSIYVGIFTTNMILGSGQTSYDISCPSTNGTKFGITTSEKIGFWNKTPIVQPTTAIAVSTFAANTSGTLNDSATWDSYTIGQIVKALRNIGILA